MFKTQTLHIISVLFKQFKSTLIVNGEWIMKEAKQMFNNKKVLIMGLGIKGGGVASAKFAYEHGAKITITDLQNENYLKSSINELTEISKNLILGEHRLKDFEEHDIIIKNPGIKYTNKFIQHAIKHEKKIETPISLFTKFYKSLILPRWNK